MLRIFESELLDNIRKYDVILIPMGINNSFNSGFAKDIYINFNEIKKIEGELTKYGDRTKFGTVAEVKVGGMTFVFCYMNNGGYRGGDSVNYTALESCLNQVAKRYGKKTIGTPLLGYGRYDGNGDIEKIKSIFTKCTAFQNVNIDVYVFENKDRELEFFREIAALRKRRKDREITAEEYSKLRSNIEWRRKHGTLNEMPADFRYRPKRKNADEQIFVKKNNIEE